MCKSPVQIRYRHSTLDTVSQYSQYSQYSTESIIYSKVRQICNFTPSSPQFLKIFIVLLTNSRPTPGTSIDVPDVPSHTSMVMGTAIVMDGWNTQSRHKQGRLTWRSNFNCDLKEGPPLTTHFNGDKAKTSSFGGICHSFGAVIGAPIVMDGWYT